MPNFCHNFQEVSASTGMIVGDCWIFLCCPSIEFKCY